MARTIKLRSVLLGGHVHTDVFMGPTGGTLGNLGCLINEPPDYRIMRDALVAGAGPEAVRVVIEEPTSLERTVTPR